MKTVVLLCMLMTGGSLMRPSYSQGKDAPGKDSGGKDWHLTRLSTASGLASSDISALFQDTHSFLWVGHSAGVSRFDGYDFENLLFAENHRIGKVYSIIEDKDQTIWIGAEGGLFFYRQNELLYAGTGSRPCIVYALALGKGDSLWVGTAKGPARLSILKLRAAALKQASARKQEGPHRLTRAREQAEAREQAAAPSTNLPYPEILPAWQNGSAARKKAKFISVAADGTIYFSDAYTLFKYADNKLTKVYTINNNRDYITGIAGVNLDTVYLSSQLSGFWMIDKKTVHRYSFSNGIGNSLTMIDNQLFYFASEGVYNFDPKRNQGASLVALPDQYQEWGSCVLRDKENNIWIGTHEELLLARPDLFHSLDLPFLEGFNELYALYIDANGSLLVGGNRGRLFEKNNDNAFSLVKTVSPLSEIFDIYETQHGDTWFCSGYEGLSLLRNGKLSRYSTKEGLRHNGNYKFLSTPDKKLFVCGDNGITEIIYGPGNSISFKNYYTNTEGDNYTIVTDGIANPDGSLLLSSDRGLLGWKNDSLYSIPILNTERSNPSISGMSRDRSGNIWLSTIGDGILLCTEEEASYVLKKQFGTGDGLPSLIYLQLLIDDNDIVWAVGYQDMIRIQPRSAIEFLIESYSRNHGFTAKSFHSAKMLEDKKGLIWIATSAGLMYFEPAAFDYSFHKPVCKITGISFPDKSENNSGNIISGFSGDMQLPWHSRSLTFHFTGIHLSDPMTVQYAYRLLGADSSWVFIGHERTVNLQQLSPGSYTFQVKAYLGNDARSNIESYPFEVLSPWWQRWWFITLSAFFLVSMGIFIIRRREKNIKQSEAEKTELQQFKATSLQYQLEIEQIINFFATSMSEQKTIEAMLWDVTKNCISKLGFEDCVIYLKDEEKNVLIQKAAWGPKTTEDNKISAPIEIPLGKGIVGNVALTGNAEIVADTSTDARYIVDDKRRGSEISVPIIEKNTVIGVIDSEHSQKDFYTERHLQVLTTIASLITGKIDKINAEQKAGRKEIEVLKLNQDLSIFQLTALRAQMSPHFIFNALNSVQQYILQGNVIEANKYLSKFSKLQREILNHCDQNFIPLEKEIEMLELYLQLEQLRFNGLFSYNLQLDNNVDADEIKIPPMMVQPFVENAIWHGLMPKPENRRLDIIFSLSEDDILLCTIKDNGVGREAALRLQQSAGKGLRHKSKGLSLVYERMNILRQQYQQPFEVSITDLTDEQGNPRGTLVTLTVFAGH